MSDPNEPDEVEFEFPAAGASLDWRSRFDDACHAAGLSPALVVIAGSALIVLLAVGVWFFAPSRSDAAAVEAALPFTRPAEQVTPSSTSTTSVNVVVHVAGSVARPGVYHLTTGARVVDAIDAAGGADATADLARVNLAAPLTDGQQIYVVAVGEDPPDVVDPPPDATGSDGSAGPALVNVNTADEKALEELPGIGPALAAAIVRHRDQNGSFVAVDSLVEVSGIGEAKLAGLRDFATV